MNLQEKINQDIKESILSKNTERLAALRAVKSAILLESAKDGNDDISNDIVLSIIVKLVKQRKESASIYIEQGRKDLSDDEINQLRHLEEYLPDPVLIEDIERVVKETIVKMNVQSKKDMGRVIGSVISKLNGQVDGKVVSDLVQKQLTD